MKIIGQSWKEIKWRIFTVILDLSVQGDSLTTTPWVSQTVDARQPYREDRSSFANVPFALMNHVKNAWPSVHPLSKPTHLPICFVQRRILSFQELFTCQHANKLLGRAWCRQEYVTPHLSISVMGDGEIFLSAFVWILEIMCDRSYKRLISNEWNQRVCTVYTQIHTAHLASGSDLQ